MEHAFENHAICSLNMLALCSFFMQYARNMLEIYTEICVKYTKLLFHHAVVCVRSPDGPLPRQFWAVFLCTNILEYGRKVDNDVICSKYARNIHENLRKMHKTTLSSCCCVCSVHGRSTSTSILGGVFLFFYARISSNMVEKSKMMQYARNMLEK